MSFGYIKRDINDRLFSELVRMHHTVCQRCMKPNRLECCHIFSRGRYTTRFLEVNAIVLCASCHDWFDSHKISKCLWDKSKRVFTAEDESYHFLVEKLGYTWEQLQEIYHLSQRPFRGYKRQKKDITRYLKSEIKAKREQ